MKIIPLQKIVLVKPDEKPDKESKFGIVTPSNVEQENPKTSGKVIAVGPDVKNVKKGDTVIYATFAGEKLKVSEGAKEVEYVLVFNEDIWAILEV